MAGYSFRDSAAPRGGSIRSRESTNRQNAESPNTINASRQPCRSAIRRREPPPIVNVTRYGGTEGARERRLP